MSEIEAYVEWCEMHYLDPKKLSNLDYYMEHEYNQDFGLESATDTRN